MPKIPALPYVRSGVSEGLSANAAFRQYQQDAQKLSAETGEHYTASRRTVFLQMYSETRSARQRISEALVAPKNVEHGGMKPQPRTTQRTKGFGYWTSIFHRPIGSSVVDRFYHLSVSQSPMTPAEAEAIARREFEDAAQDKHGTVYRSVVEGAIFTGVEVYTPEQRA